MSSRPPLREQGRAALAANDYVAAAAAFEELLAASDQDVDAWFLLGVARHRMGRLELARAAFREASHLDAGHQQARFALAAVCLELGDPIPATASCAEVVALAPEDPKAWFSLAVAQQAALLPGEALKSYDRALALHPAFFDALNNRGTLLLSLGMFREAVENNRIFTAKQPYSFAAQFNLGESLIAAGSYAEASQVLQRAVQLAPNNPRAQLHAGFSLAQIERFNEAQTLLDRAVQLDYLQCREYRRSIFDADEVLGAAVLDAQTLFLLRHYDAIERCDWRQRSYFLERFSALIRNPEGPPLAERALTFRAMALGLDSSLQTVLAKQVSANYLRAAERSDRPPGIAPVVISAKKSMPQIRTRLRIGYLSGDYRLHATAWLMSSMPGLHDRDRFEIFLYSTGPDDGSALRSEIIAGADCFVDAQHFGDAQLAAAIAKDEIDILVDMAGYTQHSRPGVLARRPSPLQVSYLVYLQTSGAEWIDYAILDRQVLLPNAREFWVEKIVYLPYTLYICNDFHSRALHARSRAEEGLPEGVFVFACLNAPWKIEPETLACWAEILRRIPNSVLWLYADREEVENNLREAGHNAGIDSQRIFFSRKVLHEEHLSRYRCVDVFLDTFSCNAHTTAIEALAAGVPVVTLPGLTVVSRVCSSLLIAHGVADLVASSRDDYIEIACRLADDASHHRAVKSRVMDRSGSHLFCTEGRVREIEKAYETMWNRHVSGESPQDFDVQDLKRPGRGGDRSLLNVSAR